MSESQNQNTDAVELTGLFAFKVGMSSVYEENGELVPVTVLKVKPTFVSQVKTNERDGYAAVQVAFSPSRASRVNKSQKAHLKGAGFENGALHVKEIRQDGAAVQVGQMVSINSLKRGDLVRLSARSKGRGFAGAVKRWGLAGGPAAHGSHFHRRPGSVGNRTWPGRVMPGKRFPGHYGDELVTISNVRIVDVIQEESVVLVKGPVPGAPNSLVQLLKV